MLINRTIAHYVDHAAGAILRVVFAAWIVFVVLVVLSPLWL